MLIIASIQTLKRGNNKCGKYEVFRCFRDSVDDVIREMGIPKETQNLRENDENQGKPVLMEDFGNL